MLPGSGGSYVYLRDGFGRHGLGRLMAFLFIWQFIFSGPLEIASGYIGFASYLRYLWPDVALLQDPRVARAVLIAIAVLVGVLNIVLLYRRITSIARITVSLWVGTLTTMAVVILTGAWTFDSQVAFDFPPASLSVLLGLPSRTGASHAHRHLRLPRLLRHLLHRRRSAQPGPRYPAVDLDQSDCGCRAVTS